MVNPDSHGTATSGGSEKLAQISQWTLLLEKCAATCMLTETKLSMSNNSIENVNGRGAYCMSGQYRGAREF